jgi:hypothetical protein
VCWRWLGGREWNTEECKRVTESIIKEQYTRSTLGERHNVFCCRVKAPVPGRKVLPPLQPLDFIFRKAVQKLFERLKTKKKALDGVFQIIQNSSYRKFIQLLIADINFI